MLLGDEKQQHDCLKTVSQNKLCLACNSLKKTVKVLKGKIDCNMDSSVVECLLKG